MNGPGAFLITFQISFNYIEGRDLAGTGIVKSHFELNSKSYNFVLGEYKLTIPWVLGLMHIPQGGGWRPTGPSSGATQHCLQVAGSCTYTHCCALTWSLV